METRANYTFVGAFVVCFLVAIITFIIWVARIDFSSHALYDIYFSRSVTGLKEGGNVLYRGVPVGIVKDIAFDAHNMEKVRVTILVEDDIPLKEDTFASLEIQGITGIAYIQLSGGTSQASLLRPKPPHDRAVITTRSSVFEEVMTSLPAVLQEVVKTLEDIRPLFNEDNRKAFGESLKNIHAITKTLAPKPGKQGDIQELLSEMKAGVKEVRLLASEVKSLLADNRSPIHDFTTTGLPTFVDFLKEGKDTLITIRRVAESIERSPARFIYNDPRQGVKLP